MFPTAALIVALASVPSSAQGGAPADELIRRAEAARRAGDLPAALADLEAAAATARRTGDSRAEGNALQLAGQVQAQTGALAGALDSLDRALDVWVGLEDARLVSSTLNGMGIVHRHLGDLERALDCYREALSLAEVGGFLREQGRILTNVAVIHAERGDLRGAVQALREGIARKERAGDTASLGISVANLAELQALQGRHDLAIEEYRRALAMEEKSPDATHRASHLTNLGHALRDAGRHGEARTVMEDALAVATAASLAETACLAEGELAELALLEGRPDVAEGHAARAVEQALRAGEERAVADLWVVLSRVRLARGDAEGALSAAQEGVAVARRIDVAWMSILAEQAAGEAYRALGRRDDARASFEAAVAAIERSRERVAGGEEDRQRFLERHLLPYHALADLAFTAGDAEGGLRWAERARGRVVAEVLERGRVAIRASLTAAEVDEERAVDRRVRAAQAAAGAREGPAREAALLELADARRAREALRTRLYAAHPDVRLARGDAEPVSVEQARPLLADGRTAVLLYTVTRERTWLMTLSTGPDGRTRTALHRIPEGRAALTARVQAFRDALASRDLAVADASRGLHRLLLGPAAGDLAGRTRLFVVPDGALWELPFSALAPRAGRYLVDQAAVSYAPSLTVLLRLGAERPRAASDRTLLALGDPSPPLPSFPPLPEAERQVRALERLYGRERSAVLVGPEVREDRVKAAAGAYAVLHFATHGLADDVRPMESALLLAREPDGAAEDGRLEARELINLDLRAELVVLSACETGRGRVGDGEGMIGLSWALLIAGARNAAVSHWRVDAGSTETLLVELHRRLAATPDVAEALRQASRAVRADPRYRHPFYWAGFSLLGSGRLAPLAPAGRPVRQ